MKKDFFNNSYRTAFRYRNRLYIVKEERKTYQKVNKQ